MPTITAKEANAALEVMNRICNERRFKDPLTKSKAVRMRKPMREAMEPIGEAVNDMIDQYGMTGPVGCPSCGTKLWESEGKMPPRPGTPGWKAFQDGQKRLLEEAPMVEIPCTLTLSELVVKDRDKDGKVFEEPFALSGDEMEALDGILIMDEPKTEGDTRD